MFPLHLCARVLEKMRMVHNPLTFLACLKRILKIQFCCPSFVGESVGEKVRTLDYPLTFLWNNIFFHQIRPQLNRVNNWILVINFKYIGNVGGFLRQIDPLSNANRTAMGEGATRLAFIFELTDSKKYCAKWFACNS